MPDLPQRKGRRRDPETRSRPPRARSGDEWISNDDRDAIRELVGIDTAGTPGANGGDWQTRRRQRRAKVPHVKRLHDVIARTLELARRIEDASAVEGIEWDELVDDVDRLHSAAFGVQDAGLVARMRVMDTVQWAANELAWTHLRRRRARTLLGEKLNRTETKQLRALSAEDVQRLDEEISSTGGAAQVHSDNHDRYWRKVVTRGAARRITELLPNMRNRIQEKLGELGDLIAVYAMPRSAKPKEGYAVAYLGLLGLGCDERTLKTSRSAWRDLGRSQS